jgi:ATP-dependent exoDNAse (exonuclease V) alpha subunit
VPASQRQTFRGKINPPRMNAAIPERRPVTEEISGVIERVTFHNDENGFCVLRIRTKGHREETTVVGSLPSVTAGEWLAAEGWWVRDKEHGLQFKATTMKTVPPTTAEGIERYLGSGLAKGIGPILAKKVVLPTGLRRSSTSSRTSFGTCISNTGTQYTPASLWARSRTHGAAIPKSAPRRTRFTSRGAWRRANGA